MKGAETTRENPASAELHQQAQVHFSAANSHFAQAASAISEKYSANPALVQLAAEIGDHVQKLDGSETYLAQANSQTSAGRPQEAWETLRESVLQHREPSLWLAYIDNGRRAGIPQSELRDAVSLALQEKVFVEGDVFSQVVLTKVATEAAWTEIGMSGAARMTSERRGQLREGLGAQAARLRAALTPVDDDVARAQGQAFLALAIAYQTILSPPGDGEKNLLGEAHRLARDAMAVLEPDIAKQEDPIQRINVQEALIASRLAYGHVAMQVLPEYRDDALLALAAAFDEMAKLPFHKGDVKILGSPMITAMAGRAGDSGAKLAFEERRYRELVTRFLEGMYTLHFGNAGAAADQMVTALRHGQQSGGDPGQTGPRDASVMLGQTDGFDAQVTLQDTVRAFKILADVKADRIDTALLGAVRLLVPGASVSEVSDLDQQVLEDAIQRIQSPLVGYALSSALEAHVNSLGLEGDPRHDMLIAQASAALARVSELLRSRRMQNRYPHLVAVVRDGQQRLGSADEYHEDALQLRSRGDLAGTIQAAMAGLRRHSQSEPLWQLYLETQIEQARRGDASVDAYNQLLQQVEQATERKMLSTYLTNYYNAVLYERLGRVHDSLGAYENALVNASQPQDRIRARSKVSEVRMRLASIGD